MRHYHSLRSKLITNVVDSYDQRNTGVDILWIYIFTFPDSRWSSRHPDDLSFKTTRWNSNNYHKLKIQAFMKLITRSVIKQTNIVPKLEMHKGPNVTIRPEQDSQADRPKA